MDEDLKESLAIVVGWTLMAVIILAILVNLIYGWFSEKPMPADDDITMDGKNYYPYERVLYCLQNPMECKKAK